jgi:hypothetical protein
VALFVLTSIFNLKSVRFNFYSAKLPLQVTRDALLSWVNIYLETPEEIEM